MMRWEDGLARVTNGVRVQGRQGRGRRKLTWKAAIRQSDPATGGIRAEVDCLMRACAVENLCFLFYYGYDFLP